MKGVKLILTTLYFTCPKLAQQMLSELRVSSLHKNKILVVLTTRQFFYASTQHGETLKDVIIA